MQTSAYLCWFLHCHPVGWQQRDPTTYDEILTLYHWDKFIFQDGSACHYGIRDKLSGCFHTPLPSYPRINNWCSAHHSQVLWAPGSAAAMIHCSCHYPRGSTSVSKVPRWYAFEQSEDPGRHSLELLWVLNNYIICIQNQCSSIGTIIEASLSLGWRTCVLLSSEKALH